MQDRIIKALACNATYRGACGFAGIHYSTFQAHRNEHKEARALGNDTEYSDFFDKVESAEAEAQAALATYWTDAARTDWRAARDLLAARHPEEWRATRHEVKVEHAGNVEHTGVVTTVINLGEGGDARAYLGAIAAAIDGRRDDESDTSETAETD